MAISLLQQETQIRKSLAADILDNVAPSEANYETNTVSILDDLNNLRSALHNVLTDQSGNWYDDLVTPSALGDGSGAQRGVNQLNDALFLVEKKRILRDVHNLTDVTVPASQNYVVLGVGELPTQLTAAVGVTNQLGTVVASHGGTFGTHSLDEVAGTNAVAPLNLVAVFDGATRDPILSGGRTIWGLLQSESATDGHTINTTTEEVQISFVRVTATGDDLEAVPFADIENKVINYCSREQVRFEDLSKQDFLKGAIVDTPAGTVVSRQAAYDGGDDVTTTTNAIATLGAGLNWEIVDQGAAVLFRAHEGDAGSDGIVTIGAGADTFDVDAGVNDFNAGATIGSGGTRPIRVGVTDGVIDTSAGDLRLLAAGEMLLDDVNQAGSTWAQTDGIKLSETTQEWDDFETEFGEVSLLNAIVQAKQQSSRRKVCAAVTANLAADVDVSGPSNDNNLDADLGDLSAGTFVDDYDIFLNGQLMRNGANAAANFDVYPGTALANGQLRFERKLKTGDTLCLIDLAV